MTTNFFLELDDYDRLRAQVLKQSGADLVLVQRAVEILRAELAVVVEHLDRNDSARLRQTAGDRLLLTALTQNAERRRALNSRWPDGLRAADLVQEIAAAALAESQPLYGSVSAN